MGKIKVAPIFEGLKRTFIKRSPEILIGVGITGFIFAGILAVKATPKAMELLDDKRDELEKDDLTVAETVQTTWKVYIPSVATALLSSVCIIGANSVHMKRYAALSAACTMAETSLREYSDKVIETIGEKKEQEVRDAIAKDEVEKHPVQNSEVLVTGKGETLCYDSLSGRYFKSDIEKIKKAINDVNRRMLNENSIALNEYYEEIGLAAVGIGESVGWDIDKGYIEPAFSSQLAEDGTPCLVISFRNPPTYDFCPF